MIIRCLDLEGVLVPEIWIAVSKRTGIRDLRFTTRDIPDYDVLMRRRLKILRENGLKLKDIQNVIQKIRPLPGARVFLDTLRSRGQVLILSDTFEEFAGPLMRQLGMPKVPGTANFIGDKRLHYCLAGSDSTDPVSVVNRLEAK